MGRGTRGITEDIISKAKELAFKGAGDDSIAILCGIPESTFNQWLYHAEQFNEGRREPDQLYTLEQLQMLSRLCNVIKEERKRLENEMIANIHYLANPHKVEKKTVSTKKTTKLLTKADGSPVYKLNPETEQFEVQTFVEVTTDEKTEETTEQLMIASAWWLERENPKRFAKRYIVKDEASEQARAQLSQIAADANKIATSLTGGDKDILSE